MQTKADQKLSAGEFPGIQRTCLYESRAYSGFVIDHLKDSTGFVEVYTALTDESYFRYKLDGDLDRDTPPPSIDRRDIDY